MGRVRLKMVSTRRRTCVRLDNEVGSDTDSELGRRVSRWNFFCV